MTIVHLPRPSHRLRVTLMALLALFLSIAGLALTGGLSVPVIDRGGPLPTLPIIERCTEDMDCWDCATMGNLICGPTTIAPTTISPPPPPIPPLPGNITDDPNVICTTSTPYGDMTCLTANPPHLTKEPV